MELAVLIIGVIFVLLVAMITAKTVRIVPQARARNVERLGRYRKTLEPGMNVIIPFVDRVKPLIDLREQVVSFEGQRVITEDNLVVLINTVLFFQVTDPRAADYEIVNYIQAIEQLAATMLRSVIGSMDLEQTRAEGEKRAAILQSEGIQQAQIRTAEGDKQAAVLRAEGEKQSAILRAEGQAAAIKTVFQSIHDNDPDPKLLAYQYLQTLPQIAASPGSTMWMIPSELTSALRVLSSAFDGGDKGDSGGGPARPVVPAQAPAPADEAANTPSAAALAAVTAALLPGSTTVDLPPEATLPATGNGVAGADPAEPPQAD